MGFSQRIRNTFDDGKPSACPYIDLTKEEAEAYYHGCGWVIAVEQHGFVQDLLYVAEDIMNNNVPVQLLPQCVSEIISKIPIENSENIKFWLCMASCRQLCDPLEIELYNKDFIVRKLVFKIEEEMLEN